ncbi:MAG: hypothetical protein ACYDHY_17580 [Acidiferrobacterales bacterium]
MKHVPPGDLNPARIRCALCGDTKSQEARIAMLPGPVCQSCYDAANPEGAPYWREWQSLCRIDERSRLPFGEARKRASRAQGARERTTEGSRR